MDEKVISQYNDYDVFNKDVKRCNESGEKLNELVFQEPDDQGLNSLNERIADIGMDHEDDKAALSNAKAKINEINHMATLFREYVDQIKVDKKSERDGNSQEIVAKIQFKPEASQKISLDQVKDIAERNFDFASNSMMPSILDGDEDKRAIEQGQPIEIFMYDNTEDGLDNPF